jgi:hypothetical protein
MSAIGYRLRGEVQVTGFRGAGKFGVWKFIVSGLFDVQASIFEFCPKVLDALKV